MQSQRYSSPGAPVSATEFLWRADCQARQWLRALMAAPGTISTIFFGYSSVAIPIYVRILASESSFAWQASLVVVLACLVAILSCVTGIILVLRTMDPERYATVMIHGRSADEILFSVAKSVRKICEDLTRETSDLRKFLGRLEEIRKHNDPDTQREELDTYWPVAQSPFDFAVIDSRLERLAKRQYKYLQRIEFMKKRAAAVLGIPTRRLCDHIFQFSPSLYRDRVDKAIQNVKEIRMLRRHFDHITSDRFFALAIQSSHILSAVKSRGGWQEQLINYRDLHALVERLASMHSTSGSLKVYSRALEAVAYSSKDRLKESSGGKESVRVWNEIADRFLFLYRKQRAHPGYHLHSLLLSACSCMLDHSDEMPVDSGRVREVVAFLGAVEENFGKPDASVLLAKACGLDLRSIEVDRVDHVLRSIKLLPLYLARLIAFCRSKIRDQAELIIEEMRKMCNGDMYLVVHGYSKTVRDTLLLGKKIRAGGDSVRLFFLLGDKDSVFDARVIEDEVRVAPEGSWSDTAAGNEDVLVGLLKGGDSVVLLLGAECFDKDKRVVHARGFARGLGALKTRVQEVDGGVSFAVVVLAEEYKLAKEPLNATRFYDDHYDQVDLYHGKDIDLIVQGAAVLPKDWLGHVTKLWK